MYPIKDMTPKMRLEMAIPLDEQKRIEVEQHEAALKTVKK